MRANVGDEVGMGGSEASDIGIVEPEQVGARMDMAGIKRDVCVLWNDQVRFFSALGVVVPD